jgi:uncharacterized small protein (DUF1192 family)
MQQIINSLESPVKSELFLNTEPELARVRATPKAFMCDLLVRLTPGSSREDFESKDSEAIMVLLRQKVEQRSSADEVEEQLADLNREIAKLKAFVAEKDEELRVFTGRVKDLGAQFFAYLQSAQDGETEARGRQLQDMISFFKTLD